MVFLMNNMIILRIIFFTFYVFFQSINCFHFLHLTFHKGCVREIEYVAQELGIEITTLFIPDCKPYTFDPMSHGNVLYNMTKERANRIWKNLSDYFNTFDTILISDTTPIARIFLENNWQKPLIIWICNRFDYADQETFEADFPQQDYYDLIKNAIHLSNVRIFSFMDFEKIYMAEKGIIIGNLSIKPCAPINQIISSTSFIPSIIDKSKTFFIPPYHNDTIFISLKEKCDELNIPAYGGKYNGPSNLRGFKGIIHIPYSWSTIAFFENMQLGVPYFIPSYNFLKQLIQSSNSFFHPEGQFFLNEQFYRLSEFYNGQHPNIIYFNSWHDLQEKVKNTDFSFLKEAIEEYAKIHRKKMLQKWEDIFNWSMNYEQ